jgi:hypothetical protein
MAIAVDHRTPSHRLIEVYDQETRVVGVMWTRARAGLIVPTAWRFPPFKELPPCDLATIML